MNHWKLSNYSIGRALVFHHTALVGRNLMIAVRPLATEKAHNVVSEIFNIDFGSPVTVVDT
jgi:hypothetical protein